MEVHHHPQLHHKAKPWKEYVLECLMIFVAVSLGFIAENIRESFKEKEQRHEFAVSLVKEWRADSAQLRFWIKDNDVTLRKIDSMYTLLQQPLAQMDKDLLQQLVIRSNYYTEFETAAGTINQLTSTGLLRLFGRTNIPQLISNYQQTYSIVKDSEKQRQAYNTKVLEGFLLAHFTPENMQRSARPEFLRDGGASYKPVNSSLRNFSQTDATQFSVELMLYKSYVEMVNSWYNDCLLQASRSIQDVSKEMKLENE